ncbi:hypothetical protein L218DRAFT_550997 [Marasmius fiardii PR-910]|nr:hypothetical protein L218DRAFT_550997 [Marasmius fiardii PR-910]
MSLNLSLIESQRLLMTSTKVYNGLCSYSPYSCAVEGSSKSVGNISKQDGMREYHHESASDNGDPLDTNSAGESRDAVESLQYLRRRLFFSIFQRDNDDPSYKDKGKTPSSPSSTAAFHRPTIGSDQNNTHHTTTNSHNTTTTNNINSNNININHYHSRNKTKPKRSRWSVTTFVYNITQPVPWFPSYCYPGCFHNFASSSCILDYWNWFLSTWGNYHWLWNRCGWH